MGCDFFWDGSQPDKAKQTACSQFLIRLARTLGLEYKEFTPIDGNIVITRKIPHPKYSYVRKTSFARSLRVSGVTVYPLGKDSLGDFSWPLAGQISFVFDNRRHGTIVTVRQMDPNDRDWACDAEQYKRKISAHGPCFLAEDGGSWREGGPDGAWAVTWLLGLIRQWYMPNLGWGDDYSMAEQFNHALRGGKILLPPSPDEEIISRFLSYLAHEVGWARLRVLFSMTDELWASWCDFTAELDTQKTLSLSTIIQAVPQESRELFQDDSTGLLVFLDKRASRQLDQHGIRTIGALLGTNDATLQRIMNDRDPLVQNTLASLLFLLTVSTRLGPNVVEKLRGLKATATESPRAPNA